jgi:hypothetical protein
MKIKITGIGSYIQRSKAIPTLEIMFLNEDGSPLDVK